MLSPRTLYPQSLRSLVQFSYIFVAFSNSLPHWKFFFQVSPHISYSPFNNHLTPRNARMCVCCHFDKVQTLSNITGANSNQVHVSQLENCLSYHRESYPGTINSLYIWFIPQPHRECRLFQLNGIIPPIITSPRWDQSIVLTLRSVIMHRGWVVT